MKKNRFNLTVKPVKTEEEIQILSVAEEKVLGCDSQLFCIYIIGGGTPLKPLQ